MSDQKDPISEAAKATQEVAKATSNAIDATKQLGQFVAKFISGPLAQGMGIVEDKLSYMRWERQQRMMARATELLTELGIKGLDRPVPMKIALPLMQCASMEEDDELQDRWVRLLVNAATSESKVEVRRAYIDILEQLTPLDARILDVLYAQDFEQALHKGLFAHELPGRTEIDIWEGQRSKDDPEPAEEIKLALSNLERVGCLKASPTWSGAGSFKRVMPTLLGKYFVQACNGNYSK